MSTISPPLLEVYPNAGTFQGTSEPESFTNAQRTITGRHLKNKSFSFSHWMNFLFLVQHQNSCLTVSSRHLPPLPLLRKDVQHCSSLPNTANIPKYKQTMLINLRADCCCGYTTPLFCCLDANPCMSLDLFPLLKTELLINYVLPLWSSGRPQRVYVLSRWLL